MQRVEGIQGKLKPRVITERAFAKESDKVVLCITVPSGIGVCSCNDIPYIRDGTQSRPAEPHEVTEKNIQTYRLRYLE
jgi:predicted HTH transcriptional regulator